MLINNNSTVDNIVAPISKAIQKLEKLCEKRKSENLDAEQIISISQEVIKQNNNEIARANKVAQNLNKILGE